MGNNLMKRLALLGLLVVSLSACGGDDASLTLPSATLPSAFALSGTVFGYDGGLPGVSVTILDGIHAGQTRTTDDAGKYSFTDLAPSSFMLQAAPIPTDGYLTQQQAVTLTAADRSVNFQLQDH
jgi:hypothetical protein